MPRRKAPRRDADPDAVQLTVRASRETCRGSIPREGKDRRLLASL